MIFNSPYIPEARQSASAGPAEENRTQPAVPANGSRGAICDDNISQQASTEVGIRELPEANALKHIEGENGSQQSCLQTSVRPLSAELGGSIRYCVRPEDRLVDGQDVGAEKFRFLCQRLKELRKQRQLGTLLVTSSIPEEGKTVVATNLALSLAWNSGRVALVEADMRQARGHRAYGLGALPGLAEYLEGKHNWAAALRYIDSLGIHFLPAGNATGNPYELLQGTRAAELLKGIRSAFDWVIFDSPPLLPFADAQCLAALTDAVLLVVRPGVTTRDSLQDALATLQGQAACIAGMVLNATEEGQQEKYYYSYYGSNGKGSAPGKPARSGTRQR